MTDILSKGIVGRAGGAYIPPARLRQMTALISDPASEETQRVTWEALKKSINGYINKVNITNIKHIIPEILGENVIRGRGLFCKSVMKAQTAALPFTKVYSALVSVLNTKFPGLGELLVHRLVHSFKRAYKRNDKQQCIGTTLFLAHLVNQKVVHEIISLQILMLLLERPTDDSVEVAVGFMKEVGAFLQDTSPKAANAIYERFRAILHEGQIDKRTQYMIEVLLQIRRDKYKDFTPVVEALDLVEEEDQITHYVSLEDDLDIFEKLNVFKFDADYLENEQKYNVIKNEILGSSSEEHSDDEGEGEESDAEESDSEQVTNAQMQEKLAIQDQTNTNLINLRRGIYLTIMSSINYEECGHKLMKMNIPEEWHNELCNMIIECCSQERTYINFYGLLAERFCKISRKNQPWSKLFSLAFEETYKTIHRFETNRLRNIAKLFAHLLASDGLGWECFICVMLSEQDTTSSSRIFLKILLLELVEALGLSALKKRFSDDSLTVSIQTVNGIQTMPIFSGLFPLQNPKDTRFAINYFTSIGLGSLTDKMRLHLQNMPKKVADEQEESEESSSEDSSSESESDDSSSSESSEDEREARRKKARR